MILRFVSHRAILVSVIEMDICKHFYPDISMEHYRNDAYHHENFRMHTHTFAELFVFLSGKAIYHIEGSEYPLQPGDILLMRPAEAHYIETDPSLPYERLFLNFDTGIFSSLDPENRLMRSFFARKAGKRNLYRAADFDSDMYMTYLQNMHQDSPDNRLTILGNLMLLLQEIGILFDRDHPAGSQPDTIEYRIIRYINKNLNQDLRIPELCNRFFISRSQLCRRFQKATGTSVGRYVAAKRLIAAREMILRGKKPTEVFTLCGYQDYSTFYRAYTQYFGHSPRAELDEDPVPVPDCDRIEIV